MFKDSLLTCDDSLPIWQPMCSTLEIQKQISMAVKDAQSARQGLYCLSYDKLIEVQTNRFIDLNNLILERTSAGGFKLTRNKQTVEFSPQPFEGALWFNEIKKYAIQRNFQDEYKLLKLQGEGNYAKVCKISIQVYKAQNSHGRIFAVKDFDKRSYKNLQLEREALRLEIHIMRRIDHPGCIKFYEVFENETHIYMVTDYLEGGELFNYLRSQPNGFGEDQVLRIMINLLNSLHYLHNQRILHRDVKPENIIIRTSLDPTNVCIADFGLAAYHSPEGKYLFRRCGTPGHVAPEILKDQIYDYKVDIFSAGVLMYMMLSGQNPFHSKDSSEIVIKNYNCEINFNINNMQERISPEANHLLKLLLASNPANRPTTLQALTHPWFQKFFAQIPNMMKSLQYQQQQFIPQADLHQTIPIMNQHLSITLSSQSNSASITPQRSKSNTQSVNDRTKSNTAYSQIVGFDANYVENKLEQIQEEEMYIIDDEVVNEDQIQKVRQYQINQNKHD